MHKVATADLAPGAALGKTIYTEKGDVLLARGVALSPRYIQAIADRGHKSVYILDGVADDILPLGLISDQLRARAVAAVRTVHLQRELKQLPAIGDAIIDEVGDPGTNALTGMTALRSHEDYAFEHPLEVAVHAVMLGHRVGLTPLLLKDLVLGCLLIEIGKSMLDPALLEKPAGLDPPEFEQIMQHPSLGFDLVRQMPVSGPRPAAIVLQHHERQDGTGYPNHLYGSNRISRTEQERFDPRRISLMAEIAAVADVYSALGSDRPYRAALPAERIFAILNESAGPHLNRELVSTFVSFAQHFPIAGHVTVVGGPYNGYLGVVVRAAANAPARPTVRLMFDASGASLGAGDELDTVSQPAEVTLRLLPESGESLEAIARQRSGRTVSS